MMKVLQINAVYNVGSTGVIVSDLHELSIESGIDSYVAYSTSPISSKNIVNGYRVGRWFGKKVHAVLGRVNGEQAYFSKFATKKFLKYIDKISPDIVHLHNLHSNYINLNMLLNYLGERDIKTVITLHDCWFFTGGCFYYTADNCDRWLSGCGKCPKKYKDTLACIFDKSARILKDRKKYFSNIKSLDVVGVSNWTAEEAKKTFLKTANVSVIHNGIDTEFFVNTASDFKKQYGIEDKFVVLGPASKWLKDVNKETFDYFVSNLPDDCVLALLGCTPRQEKHLPKGVVSIPFIKNRDELRKIYSLADVFANCTREDALSLINLEAQSCGTPVITYRNSGVQETVDNKCGFSVECGNVKEFFDTVMRVKEIGKANLTDNARKWVVENFNKNENYKKYIDLYKALASSEE